MFGAVEDLRIIPFPKAPAISRRHAEIADLIVGDGRKRADDVETVLLLTALAELLIGRSGKALGRADLSELLLALASLQNSILGGIG